MTDLFESYASDFAQLQKSIEARLAVDFTSMSADTRRSALRHAEAEAEEAGELVMQMELEVQSFPTSVRDRYMKELHALKESLDKLQLDIRAKQGDRTPYGSSGLPLDDHTYTDLEANDEAYQRQRLLQGTQVLERGSERLARSTRLALETEDVGAGILQDLQRQREQIEHSRDTVRACL